jgi:hypothetical protein
MEGFQKAPLQGGCGATWVRCRVAQYLVRRREVLKWVAQSRSVGCSSSSGVEGVVSCLSVWSAGQLSSLSRSCGDYNYCAVEQVNSGWSGRMCDAMRAEGTTSGSIRQDRVGLAAAGWLIAWWVLIGCGVWWC